MNIDTFDLGDEVIIKSKNKTFKGTIKKSDKIAYSIDFPDIDNKSIRLVVSNKTLSPDKYIAKPYPYDSN